MVTVSSLITDVTGRDDNDVWRFTSVIRSAVDGSVITTRVREARPVSGNLSVELEPGFVIVEFGDYRWNVTVPETDANLWDLIEDAVAHPPDTSQEQLAAAVGQYVMDNADQLVGVDGVQPSTDGTAVEFLRNDDVIGEVGFGNIFVRFVDQNGDPLPEGSLTTIHVNTVTGDIDDITFAEA